MATVNDNEDTQECRDLVHSESSATLKENDINVRIEDQSSDKPTPSTSYGASSESSISNHNGTTEYNQFYATSNTNETHVGRPKSFPHFIGYHPTKLVKIKGRLHGAASISFLPDNKLIVADITGHIEIFDSDGKFEKTVVKAGKPSSIATNRSGMFAFVDLKNKEKAIKVGIFVVNYSHQGYWLMNIIDQ